VSHAARLARTPDVSAPSASGSITPNVDGVCANCFAPAAGNYCAECGAPRLDRRPLTVSRFREEWWNEITSLDSSTVRTLRSLLLRPGELTRAYLDGRTRWFLSPLRVYLMMFAVLLFGSSLLPGRETDVRARDERIREALTVGDTAAAHRDSAALSKGTGTLIATAIRESSENPWLQLVNAATWAWVLARLFRRQRRNYAEHVVMAMHLLAFNVILLLVNGALRAAEHVPETRFNAISIFHWLAIGTYFFLAARRVYGEPRGRTAGKAVLFVAGAQLAMIVPPLLAALGEGVKLGVLPLVSG
jgi:hypothetical protein